MRVTASWAYITTCRLPYLSFEADEPSVIVPVIESPNGQLARQKLLAVLLELFQLATGPSDYLPNPATGVSVFSITKPPFDFRSDYSVPIPLLPDLALQVQELSPYFPRCLD
jgi:6-hydroxytryprostatin B O-methyltransferase